MERIDKLKLAYCIIDYISNNEFNQEIEARGENNDSSTKSEILTLSTILTHLENIFLIKIINIDLLYETLEFINSDYAEKYNTKSKILEFEEKKYFHIKELNTLVSSKLAHYDLDSIKSEYAEEVDEPDFFMKYFNVDYSYLTDTRNEDGNIDNEQNEDWGFDESWDFDVEDEENENSLFYADVDKEDIDPLEIKRDSLGNLYSVGDGMFEDNRNKNRNEDW